MITIPTLQELYTQIKSDLEAELNVTIPTFGKSFLRVFALVQAAKLKLYYLAIANLQKNIFVDTAEPENIGGTLERFGRVKLNRNPFAATSGYYNLTVTGTTAAVISAGTTFKSDDSSANPNKLFILDTAYTMPSTTGTINVRALEAGVDSKLDIGNTLTATAPIALVNSTATVATETIEPRAAETIEEYRAKALEAYRLEPQGGAGTDYRLWAADAQGVQRVYPYAKTGSANELVIYVEATIADSTDGKGTPSLALLEDVEEVIEFDPDITKPLTERGRRPLGIFNIDYLPVTIQNVEVVITGYVGLTTPIQTALAQAITSEINKIRPFVSSADIIDNKNDILSINKIISTIISTRPGAVFTSVGIEVNNTPITSYTFINGNIPYVQSITFV